MRRTFFEGLADWHADRPQAAREKWQKVIDMDAKPEDDVDVEILMEAALRLDKSQMADDLAQTLLLSGELISVRAQVLRGIAKLMLDQPDLAKRHFEEAKLRLERGSRIHSGLDADQWELLTQLVPSPEQTAGLAHLFDTGIG
jgi:hypothetical protein